MTKGIGGSTVEAELKKISDMTTDIKPIGSEEFRSRVDNAVKLMRENEFETVYLHAGTNLYYFTGTTWSPSERMMGVLLTPDGNLNYIGPKFEEGTINNFIVLKGSLHCWEEHESPYKLFGKILNNIGVNSGKIGIDETIPLFITEGIKESNPGYEFTIASPVTSECRMRKSDNEIAIIQRAMDITLEVQKATAKILYTGISAEEVVNFIHKAHIKAGVSTGSFFCIVLFGKDSQYPHGVPVPKNLENNEVVLIDTGCQLHGYISDITRTYVFGKPTARQREIWDLEKAAQQAAFDAAKIGATCSSVDSASRKVLEEAGLGPDYKIPGLPHRVGHGLGLDIHEYPYLVRGSEIKLEKGMVVTNEPMICVPGEFGIRHEDDIYMTDDGPRWFTNPMKSIDDPFGQE
jgi:Xaa-Pro dipeptidase